MKQGLSNTMIGQAPHYIRILGVECRIDQLYTRNCFVVDGAEPRRAASVVESSAVSG